MARLLSFAAAASVLLGSWTASVLAQDVDPIVIKGSKFFYKTNGTQFFVRGIAYQQDFNSDRVSTSNGSDGFVDPLADSSGCSRDVPYLRQLDTNVIRVYAIDPTQSHDDCMSMMADAGIYVIADLGAPKTSIDSNDPNWNVELFQRYTDVVDAMAKYNNLLGFFAGNEVVTQPNNSMSAPFVKAAVRDTKAYIKSKNYRPIGVGYATNDNPDIRVPLADYMNCGDDQADAVDFWGYNVYSWCGDATFQSSGYDTRVQQFESYSVPVFFAEYGCNKVEPRMFTETPVLYGPMMDDVFSGGIVYLYFQGENDYGLVEVDGNSVSTLADFTNLKSQITKSTPSATNMGSYNPTNSPQACPTSDADFEVAVASGLPPSPDSDLCDCMYSSLSCVVDSSVDETDYGDLFGYVCGLGGNTCDGIAANGSTGDYGRYGMCDPKQQLGYVLNQYYVNQDSSASACSFSGSATTQAAKTPSGCEARLSSASSAGITGAGSGGSSSSKGAASMSTVAGFENAYIWAGVFFQVAIVSGLGMIML